MTAWWSRTEALEAAIERTNGRSRGFDYLRIILACSVVVWHSARVSYPGFNMSGWLRPTAGLILPMFFALSGYLVSGSLLRSRSVHEFVALRAMRIVPALAVETLLSVLLIGSLLTTLSFSEFFSHKETFKYGLNIVGWIHFRLPGVFEGNPYGPTINASLWTIPYELECYLIVVILLATRLIKSRWALLAATLLLQFFVWRSSSTFAFEGILPGRVFVLAFVYGVVFFVFRRSLPLNFALFVAAVAIAGIMLVSGRAALFVGLPAAYATVYLGLTNPPKVPVLMDGDYSYGVYLYSFPIQQSIAWLLPNHREWWINLAIALPLSGLCAAFSWHVVEKPVLRYRKPIIGWLDRTRDRLQGRPDEPDPAMVSVLDRKSQA